MAASRASAAAEFVLVAVFVRRCVLCAVAVATALMQFAVFVAAFYALLSFARFT